MKLGLCLVNLLGLMVLCASSKEVSEVSADDAGEANEKRFSADGSNSLTPGDGAAGLVDWSSNFNKRAQGFQTSNFVPSDNDGNYVDWSKMFKRFQTAGASKLGDGHVDAGLVNWHKAFAKRFSGNIADSHGEKLVDWSSTFNKRFGQEGTVPDSPNLIDWSAAFAKKKRSKRGANFKRIRGGNMNFGPDAFQSSDLVDWSKMFKRGFGEFGGFEGNPNLQDWRNMLEKRRFGESFSGQFGQDGLNPYGLQNWSSYRKRRSAERESLEN